MSKQKGHVVQAHKDSSEFTLVLSRREIESKVRKPLPPPSQTHRDKTAYSRKTKHKGKEV